MFWKPTVFEKFAFKCFLRSWIYHGGTSFSDNRTWLAIVTREPRYFRCNDLEFFYYLWCFDFLQQLNKSLTKPEVFWSLKLLESKAGRGFEPVHPKKSTNNAFVATRTWLTLRPCIVVVVSVSTESDIQQKPKAAPWRRNWKELKLVGQSLKTQLQSKINGQNESSDSSKDFWPSANSKSMNDDVTRSSKFVISLNDFQAMISLPSKTFFVNWFLNIDLKLPETFW